VTPTSGLNTDEVGLARAGDGVLHVVWRTASAPLHEEIWHASISPAGKLGPSTAAATGWSAAGGQVIVVLPDGGLRVFFGGLGSTNEQGGVQSVTADAQGSSWTAQGTRVSSSVSAAGPVGAAVLADGAALFAWPTGSHLYVHAGLSSSDPDLDVGADPRCCFYSPNVAVDRATGQVALAFYSLAPGEPGIFVQTIRPTVGQRELVPSSLSNGSFVMPDQRAPLVARAGGGVYLAYCAGYPGCARVLLWKVGSAEAPRTVASGKEIEDVNASPGPDGRIWVMWHDHSSKTIYARRSNRAATRFGPKVSVRPPAGTSTIWKLAGEGSPGPLDVLASVSTPGSLATWHTQLLPPLSLACTGNRDVTCSVADAGDPVPGAKVAIGGKSFVANAQGRVKARVARGAANAVATKAGFASARSP
jgi:hypothetical protein